MRQLLAFLTFLVFCDQALAQSPNYGWVSQVGGPDSGSGADIVVDSNGNSYVTGNFSGTLSFGSISLVCNGPMDAFIAKYDSAGNVLWAKRAGGSGMDWGYSIGVDSIGNCFVTGYFKQNASFSGTILTSNGDYDVFVAKYNPSGVLIWARSGGGGSGADMGVALAVDKNGNCYIAGQFEHSNAVFGNYTLSSSGDFDILIVKYDPSGNVLWANKAGGTGYDSGYGIAIDSNGSCYVSGPFSGTASFGSNTIVSSGLKDAFIAKYDSSGTPLWVRKVGGTGDDQSYAITVDKVGNSYMLGHFKLTVNLNNTSLISNGGSDIFLAKYGPTGTLIWAVKGGGVYDDFSRGVEVDEQGYCYATGWITGSATFGSVMLNASGDSHFIIKYNPYGTVVWGKNSGGYSRSIEVDEFGNSYVIGAFSGTISFDSFSLTSTTSSSDVFISKLKADTLAVTSSVASEFSQARISLYPNPCNGQVVVELPNAQMKDVSIMVCNTLGQLQFACKMKSGSTNKVLNLNSLAKGTYFISILTDKLVQNRLLVIE